MPVRGVVSRNRSNHSGNIEPQDMRPAKRLLCALRNGIECFFNKPKTARRVATRNNETVNSFPAFINLASIKLWLKFV